MAPKPGKITGVQTTNLEAIGKREKRLKTYHGGRKPLLVEGEKFFETAGSDQEADAGTG